LFAQQIVKKKEDANRKVKTS